MLKCSSCQRENGDDASVCIDCGTRLVASDFHPGRETGAEGGGSPLPPMSTEPPWKRFADEVGGEYGLTVRKLGPFKLSETEKVVTNVERWTVTLDSVKLAQDPHGNALHGTAGPSTLCTRMSSPCEVRVSRFGLGRGLLERYSIGSGRDSEHKFNTFLATLMSDDKAQELLNRHQDISIQIGHYFREHVHGVTLLAYGLVANIEELKSLHELFVRTLTALHRLQYVEPSTLRR